MNIPSLHGINSGAGVLFEARWLQNGEGVPSPNFLRGFADLKLLSCFADESGQQDMNAGYYMLTLVLHDQSNSIKDCIEAYESRLSFERLSDIPFHTVDLLHGHGRYENETVEARKRLLIAFSMFVRTLPIHYQTFTYNKAEINSRQVLQARMRRDVVNFIFENLDRFQEYDSVPLYYDGGHETVTAVLQDAFDYALAKGVAVYRDMRHEDKRLAQAADYICSIELAERSFSLGTVSATYTRFYGSSRNFRQNFLKQVRRKHV